MLVLLATTIGTNNWNKISLQIGMSPRQCSLQYAKLTSPGRLSQRLNERWTGEEDERLKRLVQKYGKKNWVQIAQFMPGRIND